MGNIPLWLCIPFAGLLLCIAIFPLVKGEWWDKNKGWAVLIWSLLFMIPFAVKYGAGETAETVLECIVMIIFPLLCCCLVCFVFQETLTWKEISWVPRV